jgi:hypothetical protein
LTPVASKAVLLVLLAAIRFLTYAMTYATDEDIEILRKYFSDQEFKAALDDPTPGIFDQSSWAKWNQHYGRTPIPPLPKRRIHGRRCHRSRGFLSREVLKTAILQ